MPPESNTPRYRRHVPRGQARAAVLDAAARLFSEQGYSRTSLTEIAEAAQVARPTVFTSVGNKPTVLRAVVEAQIGGVDPAAAVTELPWFAEALTEPEARRLLRLHARNIRAIGERISRLYYATELAASTDAEVAALWQELEQGRLTAARAVAAELHTRAGVRPGLDEDDITDVLFCVVSPPVYRMLVHERGWSPERFEQWADATLTRTLLGSAAH